MCGYEKYLFCREIAGYKSDNIVSKNTGIPSSTFTEWKKGTYTPKLEKLVKIADFLGCSVLNFFDDADPICKGTEINEYYQARTTEESLIIDAFRRADEGIRKSVLKLLDIKS